MKIVWDEPKRQANIEVHGLDFADADRFAWDDALFVDSYPSPRGGRRFVSIGFLDDDLIVIVFAPLGTEGLSIISMRSASRKERALHDDR